MTSPELRELAPEQALRRLELTVFRRLDGLLHGDYLGLVPGQGTELAEAREYRPAEDDVRSMDWNVTARTTVPHVRDLVADRELQTWALVDASASMDFGTARLEKRDLAVAAVAAVGFLMSRAGNRLGALTLEGDTLRPFPARSGRQHLLALLRTLLAAPRTPPSTAAGPSLADAVDTLGRISGRRGLAVVVSDFLGGPDDSGGYSGDASSDGTSGAPAWERSLRRLALRHQVLAVETVDPRELELPDVGVITLVDPETGRTRDVSTSSRRLRERYAAAAAQQRQSVRDALRRAGATRLTLRTDRDWVRDIIRHVHTERRLAGAPGEVGAQRPNTAARLGGGPQ